MAQKFTVPITVKQLTSAGSDAITVYVDQDTYARLKLEAGGRLTWGPGASAGDVNLYRDAADVLKTDDTFKAAALFVDGIEIDPTGATTDQVLKFDGTKFVPGTDGGGGGGATTLDELTDVTAPSPSSGDFLKWDGSAWVNDAIDLGTDTTGNYVSNIVAGTGITVDFTPGEDASASVSLSATLNDLSDVSTVGASVGNVLTYNGSSWTAASAGGGGASVTVSDAPPASPSEGDLWFESDTTRTYVYYDSFWVEVGSTGAGATTSDTAPTNPVQGQFWFNSLNGATYVYYGTVWLEVGAVSVNTLLSTIQAKGDLLVGTASATVDNLGVGNDGDVLTADSSTATGLKWAPSTGGGGGLNTSTDGVFITMAIGM